MATFAQIVSGRAYNVVQGASLQDALGNCFVAGYDGGHPGVNWQAVPDGTVSGATDNGNGTFTNPGTPAASPLVFTNRKAVRKYLVDRLGGGATGEIRLGAIFKGIKASTDERVNYAWDYFSAALDFEKTEVVALFQLARIKDLPSADTTGSNVARKVEAAEITAIQDNWPTA